MKDSDMPKAIMRREDGTKEEIIETHAYHYYLTRLAVRIINQLKTFDELDDNDVLCVAEKMALLSKKSKNKSQDYST